MKSALLVVYPAYGRQYVSADALKAGFQEGRDFSPAVRGGPYMSIRDMVQGPHSYKEAYDALSNFNGVILTQLSPRGARVEFQTVILREEMAWPPKA